MPLTHLECTRCSRRYEPGQVLNLCECRGPLFARYNLDRAAKEMRPGTSPASPRCGVTTTCCRSTTLTTGSLGEGFTPLLAARRRSEVGPRLS
jgi:threonine synthase